MKTKKILASLCALFLFVTLFALSAFAADNTVVYLKSSSAGDGSAADNAVGTMEEAFNALDLTKDCTIVLCGEFSQGTTFVHESTYTGSVTITSVYGGVDYRQTAGAVYTPSETRFICTGAVTFKDIDFYLQGKYFYVVAQHNPLVIDTGVTMQSANTAFAGTSFANGFDICGGYQNAQEITLGGELPPLAGNEPVNITVRSGCNMVIAAYSRQLKETSYSGKATINIEGDAQVGVLYFAPVNAEFGGEADVEINVKDNAQIYNIYGGTNNGTMNSVTLNWESGDISSFARSTRNEVTTTAANGYTLNYSQKVEQEATFFPLVILNFDVTKPTYTVTTTDEPKATEPATPATTEASKATEPAAPTTTEAPKATEPAAPTTTEAPKATDPTAPAVTTASAPAPADTGSGVPVTIIAIVIVAVAVIAAIAIVLLKKKK